MGEITSLGGRYWYIYRGNIEVLGILIEFIFGWDFVIGGKWLSI